MAVAPLALPNYDCGRGSINLTEDETKEAISSYENIVKLLQK
jgi:hypothetical protein